MYLLVVLVKENRDVHILMSDYNYDEHNELSDGGNTTVIPTKNVIQKFLIKNYNKGELYYGTSEKIKRTRPLSKISY